MLLYCIYVALWLLGKFGSRYEVIVDVWALQRCLLFIATAVASWAVYGGHDEYSKYSLISTIDYLLKLDLFKRISSFSCLCGGCTHCSYLTRFTGGKRRRNL